MYLTGKFSFSTTFWPVRMKRVCDFCDPVIDIFLKATEKTHFSRNLFSQRSDTNLNSQSCNKIDINADRNVAIRYCPTVINVQNLICVNFNLLQTAVMHNMVSQTVVRIPQRVDQSFFTDIRPYCKPKSK